MAQPPLSVSIAKLEAELGIQLFQRHPRGVYLTTDGAAALKLAEEIVWRADELRESAKAGATRGKLRIGMVSTSIYDVLPKAIAAFREAFPAVELHLEETSGIAVRQGVEAGRLDVGIVRTPMIEPTPLKLIPLETSYIALAVPSDHRLATRSIVELAELSDETFVLYDASAANTRAAVILACQKAGFIPKVSHTISQIQALVALVEMNLGIALVPDLQHAPHGTIRIIPLTCGGEKIATGLTLVVRAQERSPVITAFCEAAIRANAKPEGGDSEVQPLSAAIAGSALR